MKEVYLPEFKDHRAILLTKNGFVCVLGTTFDEDGKDKIVLTTQNLKYNDSTLEQINLLSGKHNTYLKCIEICDFLLKNHQNREDVKLNLNYTNICALCID